MAAKSVAKPAAKSATNWERDALPPPGLDALPDGLATAPLLAHFFLHQAASSGHGLGKVLTRWVARVAELPKFGDHVTVAPDVVAVVIQPAAMPRLHTLFRTAAGDLVSVPVVRLAVLRD